ncbi:MAG: endonuclease/exonuclease/phosphatase family protein [Pirellulales bacterium]
MSEVCDLARRLALLLTIAGLSCQAVAKEKPADTPRTIRVATYNTSLFRDKDGELVRDLETGTDQQAQKIAEVIQRVRPDVMLCNEFDYDAGGQAAVLFQEEYLAVGQNGLEPIRFNNHYIGPVNTGRPSGLDLDNNGRTTDPTDAFGYGTHEGQYGMLVLSRFPIEKQISRTFQTFLWRNMPGALLPLDPKTNKPYYSDAALAILRLPSKSFWDLPVEIPASATSPAWKLHLLCSHPTPPVFDGREDRNGRRNHDEIRLLADYISPDRADFLVDDAGGHGGLDPQVEFVILGDLNCDPVDGEGLPGAMQQLLDNPRVNSDFTPTSAGAKLATESRHDANAVGKGDPAHDTSNFGDFRNLRIDYALPSRGLKIVGSGVFWPTPDEPGAEAITATDHRLVWIDIETD